MAELSSKQKKVMDELFEGGSEKTALEENGVSQRTFNKWVTDEVWQVETERRIGAFHRQAQVLIAAYSPVAAAKLIQLTDCEKEVTARQACLDIIQMQRIMPEFVSDDDGSISLPESPEIIDKLVKILAEDAQKKRKNKP